MPQNAPDFIPAESSPDFIPASEPQKQKPRPQTGLAARRNAMAQPGITPAQRAASPINQGVLTGLQDFGTGASLATGIDAPLTTAISMGGGYLAGKGARLGARALGAGEGWQDAAELGGNLAGSFGTSEIMPGLRNLRLHPLEMPEPTEAQKLQASIDRSMARRAGVKAAREATEGVPAQPLTQSPNLPKLLAARSLARQSAREALEAKMQTGTTPKIGKSGVLQLPEPREALPTEKPNYLPSIPRERLTGLAMKGYPGAGDLLKNEGKTIIYVVPEYPGPRTAKLPKPFILPNAAD